LLLSSRSSSEYLGIENCVEYRNSKFDARMVEDIKNETLQSVEELNQIFHYVSPELHQLHYKQENKYTTANTPFVFDTNLMDTSIRDFPRLQGLDVNGVPSLKFCDQNL
jgi:hypothetical protein